MFDNFAIPAGMEDMSLQILYYIFGPLLNVMLDVKTNSMYADAISQGFILFNSAILFLGSVYVLLHSLSAVAKTAHEGEVMGKQWSTLWVPMRVGIGFAVLLPLSSGYSLIQVLVMWFTLQGVGLADNIYSKMAAVVTSNPSTVFLDAIPNAPSILPVAHELFKSYYCLKVAQEASDAVKAEEDALDRLISGEGFVKFRVGTGSMYDKPDNMIKYQFGDYQTSEINSNQTEPDLLGGGASKYGFDACGSYVITNSLTPDITDNISQFQIDYEQKYLVFFKRLMRDMRGLAEDIHFDKRATPAGYITEFSAAVNEFDTKIQDELDKLKTGMGSNLFNWSEFITGEVNKGWISGGSIYFEMTKINDRKSIIANKSVTGISYDKLDNKKMAGIAPHVDAKMKQAYLFSDEWGDVRGVNVKLDQPLIEIKCKKGRDCIDSILREPMTMLGMGMKGIFDESSALESSSFLDNAQAPIGLAVSFGRLLMNTGDLVLMGSILTGFAADNVLTGAVGGGGALMALLPMITIVFVALVFFGATLAFYIPMVPYVIWIGGIVSWLVTVAEAMIIAPIWAISFLSPDGEGFTSEKAKQGWLLVLSVFLRPTLMLFGLFFAAAISFAVFAYINGTYANVYETSSFADPSYKVGLLYLILGYIAQVAIYVIITLTTMNTIYGLIHIIPDRVLRWIGGGDAPLGDMGAEQQSKQAFGAVIGSGSGAAQSAMGGGGGKDNDPNSKANQDAVLAQAALITQEREAAGGGGGEGNAEKADTPDSKGGSEAGTKNDPPSDQGK